jgi:hypothetical protein
MRWCRDHVVEKWKIRTADPNHCVATWDRVLLQVWHFEVTPAAVIDLERVARDLIALKGNAISSLAIVEASSPPPGDVVRQSLSKFYRDLAPQLNTAIVVGEGGGFRGAIVRSVGVALSMLAPRALPFKFVGSVSEATTLVAPHLSLLAGGAASLEEIIVDLRTEIKAGTLR